MKATIVRYKVKPERAEENREYVRAVFAELERKRPAGLRYVSFNLDDAVTFIHVAVVDTANDENPLTETDAFKTFVAAIHDRCDEPPVARLADSIGIYRLFES